MLLHGVIFRIKDYSHQKGKGITETPKEHQRKQSFEGATLKQIKE